MGQVGRDSGAPAEGVVTPAQREEATGDVEGTRAAAETLRSEQNVEPMEEGYVSFVAAPEYANEKILVHVGKEVRAPQEGVQFPGVRRRDGDIKAAFSNGVLVTNDPVVIKWCDDNPTKCRRADDPLTPSWATLKEMTTRRANRDPLEDASHLNADAAFPQGGLDALREQAAKSGSSGDDAVKNAQLTQKSIEAQQG